MIFDDVSKSMKALLERVQSLPSASYTEFVHLISPKAVRHKEHFKQGMLPSSGNSVVQEHVTEQICQLMQASLAFHL